MSHAIVTLKPGREKALVKGNPWIFSGAVRSIESCREKGQLCEIHSADGTFLALGYVNPDSKIPCRVLSREQISIDRTFLSARIAQAVHHRDIIAAGGSDAFRLVNSEGDFLPGLVIDRYGKGIVVQFLTCGMERFRDDILEVVKELIVPSFVIERSDTPARREEGLHDRCGILSGSLPDPVTITENGLTFKVDCIGGHKTGFYLDQRDSRLLIRQFTGGKRVLNLFSYTGGFSVAVAAGGAVEVVSVDSSGPALALAAENMALNGFSGVQAKYVRADVFKYLNNESGSWDLIVLDPPAFAAKKTDAARAARGYKDINLRALKKLVKGGILATFSCSHHIPPVLFRQIVYAAVSDSGRQAQCIIQTSHPLDHPFDICHKEGEYLKGLFLRIIE